MNRRKLTVFGAAVVALTIGAAPILSNAADHLDAPALGRTVLNGQIDLASFHGDRDINDVYVFPAPDGGSRTVLAMTVNPAINLFGGNFGTDVRYIFNIDTNGDNVQDVAYVTRYGDEDGNGDQKFKITKYTGSRAVSLTGGKPVVHGFTNAKGKVKTDDGLWAWSGVRSDPFFFDLLGFIGTVSSVQGAQVGTDTLGDGDADNDFFANLNTNALVLSIPDGQLPDTIGVWANTSYYNGTSWIRADQMGRPAINTVFMPSADKNAFNTTPPSQQKTAMGGKFFDNVVGGLQFFSSLDTEGAYADAQAEALANVLIPDVLVYSRTGTLPAPLNGRALADDVIDVELIVTTGGDPLGLFADRDASGAINSDGVGAHTDYLGTFPYLGLPH
jgi:hypothetical protein